MNSKEKEILAKNNPYTSYYYCYTNEDANVSFHEEIILKSNNPFFICPFARDIKNANKEKLFRRLLELNDLDYINYFLENIDFDKEKFKELLIFL